MHRNQYDTDVTTWSPQGRLFQVEYAAEAVQQGSACVGVRSKTHAVLAGLRRAPDDALAKHQEKLFSVDKHMGIVISGLTADARALLRYMRMEAVNHRYVYEAPMNTGRLVEQVADMHQECTHSYVRRPYGVGLLVAGFDSKGPHVYQTSPSGNYWEFHGTALGARSQSAKTYLEKHRDELADASRDDLIRMAVASLSACCSDDQKLTEDNLALAVVSADDEFRLWTREEVAPLVAALEATAGAGAGAGAAAAEGMDTADEAPADA